MTVRSNDNPLRHEPPEQSDGLTPGPVAAETIVGTVAEGIREQSAVRLKTLAGAAGSLLPPEFGRYRVEKLLGRGGMGAVYLAQDTQLNRPVALKVPTLSDNQPQMLERFYREARAAGTLSHPGICPVYDVGEIDGVHFISMGYIDGRPLSAYVASGKKQAERHVAGVIRRIALALQEAHDKGFIHRDLKPANIMIDRRGEPVVMDFGLARRHEDEEESRLTREGTVVGSPAYMSPEQVSGRKLGPTTDIYSLGVVLYELLTGHTPFRGLVINVISQILHDAPPPPSQLRNDLSAEMDAICLKAIAKQPEERFASMKEFAQALSAFQKGDSSQVLTGAAPTGGLIPPDVHRQKAEVSELLRLKRYREAVTTLNSLAQANAPEAAAVAAWAKSQLTQAQTELDRLTEETKSLYRRAKKCMESQDYERAQQLLEQIPEDMTTAPILDLRAEARDLTEEVGLLSLQVEQATRTGDFEDMLPVVQRLLELKPQHRQAADLYEQLFQPGTTAPIQMARTPGRHRANRTELTPAQKLVIGSAASAALLIGLMIYVTRPEPQAAFADAAPASADRPHSVPGTTPSKLPEPPQSMPPDRSPVSEPPVSPPPANDRRIAQADSFEPELFPLEAEGDGRRPFPPGPPQSAADFFRILDRNEDRKVDEFEIPPHLNDLRGMLDPDDDGQVTLAELERAWPEIKRELPKRRLDERRRPGPFGPRFDGSDNGPPPR